MQFAHIETATCFLFMQEITKEKNFYNTKTQFSKGKLCLERDKTLMKGLSNPKA